MIRHMDIKLSYACNNNCIHCVIADQRDAALKLKGRDFRTQAEVVGELTSAKARGFDIVTFTGGEPTIRRDLPDLIVAARALGLGVGLQTNGRILAYPEIRKSFLGHQVRFVMAVHGPDAATHDEVTRAPGSFVQVIEAVSGLLSAGEKVSIKTVLSTINVSSLPKMAVHLCELGAKRWNITFPHALGNARREFEIAVPRYRDVTQPLSQALDMFHDRGCSAVTEAVPLCILGRWADRASETGYRTSGLNSEVHQLDQDPRNWNEDRFYDSKAKPATCRSCKLDNICEGVWKEYLDHFGWDELIPMTKS